MKTVLFSGLLVAIMVACQPKSIEGGSEIAREAELHKVKRITKDQIYSEAFLLGDSIVQFTNRIWRQRLDSALKQSQPEAVLALCRPAHYPEVQQKARAYNSTLQRITAKPRNPTNKITGKKAELLEAYQYNAEKGLPSEPNVQQTGENQWLYTAAISISDPSCLVCHGKPLQDIPAANWAAIQSRYPQDQSVGYNNGEWMGIWSIEFEQAGLAKSIGARGKKKRKH